MSQITRPLIATLWLVGLWFLAMVLEALDAPAWALALNGGLLLANLGALIVSIHEITCERERPDGEGGVSLDRPDAPDPDGGDDPSWWPGFERELAQYVLLVVGSD
jgi:hypothetical protein